MFFSLSIQTSFVYSRPSSKLTELHSKVNVFFLFSFSFEFFKAVDIVFVVATHSLTQSLSLLWNSVIYFVVVGVLTTHAIVPLPKKGGPQMQNFKNFFFILFCNSNKNNQSIGGLSFKAEEEEKNQFFIAFALCVLNHRLVD